MNLMARSIFIVAMCIVIVAIGSRPAKAQVQLHDEAPVRLIERLTDSWGDFPVMVASDDGQVIAVYTRGPELAGLPPFPEFTAQVLVIDRRNGTVELASRSPSGGFQTIADPPGMDYGPLSISRDGRYVSFLSSAPNLDDAVTTPGDYTYLYDRVTQQVRALNADEEGLVPGYPGGSGRIDGAAELAVFPCRSLAGLPAGGAEVAFCARRLSDGSVRTIGAGFRRSDFGYDYQLSRDGRKIAFASHGRILTTGAANPDGLTQLYLLDVQTGDLELVSRASDGTPGDGHSGGMVNFAMSDDADFVAYFTISDNIAPELLSGRKLIVTQRSTGITRRANSPGAFASIGPHLSSDGRRLIYLDYASLGSRPFVRIYDWETDSSRAIGWPDGEPPNDSPCATGLSFMLPPVYWQRLALSGDGRTALFATLASNLFPGDTPDSCDFFAQSLGPVPQPAQPAQPIPGPNAWWLGLLALLAVSAAFRTRR